VDLWAVSAIIAAPFAGSFIGVLIERLPAGRPVVLARSACDACGRALGPLDLLPLASWVSRRGRCSCGRTRLSPFYAAIELAALAVALWAAFVVPGWIALASAALGWTLLTLAVIDQRHEILPDVLTLPLIPAGLLVAWAIDPGRLADHVIGAAAGFLVFAAIAWTYHRLRGREGLGRGDAKLLAAAGAWLGWQALPSVVVIGAVSALALALARAAAGAKLSAGMRIAFGPYLALGFWLVWLHGPLSFD
jgi:leader peptidase (prepilin peptidase) / N-methyltransferase